MKVDIVNTKAIKVAALEHRGEPEKLGQSIESFKAWRKESGCSPVAEKRTFGVAHSNPEAVPVQEFHFDICGEVDAEIAENTHGLINKEIPAGRCARVRHIGSHDTIILKVHTLYRSWLPSSDEVKRDSPIFFEYLNFEPEVPESRLITDIYFPLKSFN
jgi:AraC family transcriptional regulator